MWIYKITILWNQKKKYPRVVSPFVGEQSSIKKIHLDSKELLIDQINNLESSFEFQIFSKLNYKNFNVLLI